MAPTLDEYMQQLRVASRDIFNQYFRVPTTSGKRENGWLQEERFQAVNEVLFEKMVLEPASLPLVPYRDVQTEILVTLANETLSTTAMINREIRSGYWDYPIDNITRETECVFVEFFDWDALAFRDNRYVLALIQKWPTQPDAVGKHVLIESQYIEFVTRTATNGDNLVQKPLNKDKIDTQNNT